MTVSLRRTEDFRRVFAEGRKVVADEVAVHWAPNRRALGRLGIVVSRRNGNAVERNRMRRRLREALRALGGAPPGFDVVLVARPPAGKSEFRSLKGRIWKILEDMQP